MSMDEFGKQTLENAVLLGRLLEGQQQMQRTLDAFTVDIRLKHADQDQKIDSKASRIEMRAMEDKFQIRLDSHETRLDAYDDSKSKILGAMVVLGVLGGWMSGVAGDWIKSNIFGL